jgi:L-amino acid N-acyltransferase YncA
LAIVRQDGLARSARATVVGVIVAGEAMALRTIAPRWAAHGETTDRFPPYITPLLSTIDEHSGVEIRPAQDGDMPAVAAIFAHYVSDTLISFELEPPSSWDWVEKRGDLQTAGWPFLVAAVDGEIVGYAYVAAWRAKPAYRHSVENTIYLAPAHTGQGHGRRLLRELLTRARDAGAREVIAVIADTGSQASVTLHRRAGFRDAGRLHDVGFKRGHWLDVLLMQCSLGTTQE